MAGSETLRVPPTGMAVIPGSCERQQTTSSLDEGTSRVLVRLSVSSAQDTDVRVRAPLTAPHVSSCCPSSTLLSRLDGTVGESTSVRQSYPNGEDRLSRRESVCSHDDARIDGHTDSARPVNAGEDRPDPSALGGEDDLVDRQRVLAGALSDGHAEGQSGGAPGPEFPGRKTEGKSLRSDAATGDASSPVLVSDAAASFSGNRRRGLSGLALSKRDSEGHVETQAVQGASSGDVFSSPHSGEPSGSSSRSQTLSGSSSSQDLPPPASASLATYIRHSLQRLEKVASSTRKPKALKEACGRALQAFERLLERRERSRWLASASEAQSRTEGTSPSGTGAEPDCGARPREVLEKSGGAVALGRPPEHSGEDFNKIVKHNGILEEKPFLAEGEGAESVMTGQEEVVVQEKEFLHGRQMDCGLATVTAADPPLSRGALAVLVAADPTSEQGAERWREAPVSDAVQDGRGSSVLPTSQPGRQRAMHGEEKEARSSSFVPVGGAEFTAEVQDLESLFEPFRLACESNNPKLQYPALEGLHLILVTNFLTPSTCPCPPSIAVPRGVSAPTERLQGPVTEAAKVSAVTASAASPSTELFRQGAQRRSNLTQRSWDTPPRSTQELADTGTVVVNGPLLSPQSEVSPLPSSSASSSSVTRQVGDSGAQRDVEKHHAGSSSAPSTKPPLIDRAATAICKCSESADESVVLQALRCLLTAVSSPSLELHGGALLSAVRALFEVFGNSQRSAENQRTAQAALLQTVHTVMHRYELGAVSAFCGERPLPQRSVRARASSLSASSVEGREVSSANGGEPWGGHDETGDSQQVPWRSMGEEPTNREMRSLREKAAPLTPSGRSPALLSSARQETRISESSDAGAEKGCRDDSAPDSNPTAGEAAPVSAGQKALQPGADLSGPTAWSEGQGVADGEQKKEGAGEQLGEATSVDDPGLPSKNQGWCESIRSGALSSCVDTGDAVRSRRREDVDLTLCRVCPERGHAGSEQQREAGVQGLQSRMVLRDGAREDSAADVLRKRTGAESCAPFEDQEHSELSASSSAVLSCPSLSEFALPCPAFSSPTPRRASCHSFSQISSCRPQSPPQGATAHSVQTSAQLRDVLLVLQALCRLAACEDALGASVGGTSRFTSAGFVGSLGSLVGGGNACSTKFGGDGGRKATKKLALELTRDMLQASGERLRSSRLFLSFVKQHLFVTLVRSVVVPSLCLVSLDIFLFIVQHHYRHLEHETAIFLSELLVPLLLSSSIPTDQREVILSSLVTFFVAAPASFTLGLFLDFDCSVEEKDVVLPLLETLCAQATRPVSGPNEAWSASRPGGGPSQANQLQLRRIALKALVSFLQQLRDFIAKVDTIRSAPSAQRRKLRSTEGSTPLGTSSRFCGACGGKEAKALETPAMAVAGPGGGQARETREKEEEGAAVEERTARTSSGRRREDEAGELPGTEDGQLVSGRKERMPDSYLLLQEKQPSSEKASPSQRTGSCARRSLSDFNAQCSSSVPSCATREALVCGASSTVGTCTGSCAGRKESCSDSLSRPGLSARLGQAVRQRERKSALKKGILKFNLHPRKGLEFLESSGLVDSSDPMAVARFLMRQDGLSKTRIGEVLGDGDEFSKKVLHAFVDGLDFRGKEIDAALKGFLQLFRLPGEAQKIDRIMEKFAEKFFLDNSNASLSSANKPTDATCPTASGSAAVPHVGSPDMPRKTGGQHGSGEGTGGGGLSRIISTSSQTGPGTLAERNVNAGLYECADCCYVLAFSLIMLHTDAHSREIKPEHKMSKEDFVRNNRGINNGKDVDRAYLETLYDRIVLEEWTLEDDDLICQQQQQLLRQQEGLDDSDVEEELNSVSGNLFGTSKLATASLNWLPSLVIRPPPRESFRT